jgi:hypothetical protein
LATRWSGDTVRGMKTTPLSWLLVSAVVPTLVACGGGGTKAQGGVGQACYANGTCNAGLSCFSKLCVDVNGDGAAGASGSAGAGTAGAGSAGADAAAGALGTAGADGGVDASDAPATEAGGTEAGATEAGADASTFSVATLPGLALWLDASKGIVVSNNMAPSWKDQSSNGNDAVQASQASPGYVAGAINGLPAVSFVNNTTYATIHGADGTATLGFGTGDFLVEIVAKWTTNGDTTTLFGTSTGPNHLDLSLVGDNGGHAIAVVGSGAYYAGSTSASLGDGTFRLIGARRAGTGAAATLEVRVAGAVAGTGTGVNYGVDLQSLVLGQVGPGNALDLAEVVVVKGTTSADDLAHLEAYLTAKYALQ